MNPLFLGYDAVGRKIRLTREERKTHMHVIGSSGSGKSKFLESMMRCDLRSRQGFCLIDPHGELYEEMVHYCAHHVLKREVILLDLASAHSVIGFNPFQKTPGGDVSVQVDRRIAATLRAWNVRTADATPTLERTLRLIYTIMIEQNLGLREINHLINYDAREIRAHLVERLQSPIIQKEWRDLLALKRREWLDEVLSAKNRLFRLLTSDTLARFMGLPNISINLNEIMEQGKILLVNLATTDSFSSENARVFGALLVNQFFEAAKRRKKDYFGQDPTPYYLYIDEFQNFVCLDIGDMLDQARKRGLYTILAHQRFGQLDEDIIDAVLTNCQIKAVFGGLPVPTAKRMAEELFIRLLTRLKIKVAIYQTKFWPKYCRDTVYTTGTTHSTSHGTGDHDASGSSFGDTFGQFFQPGDWFGAPAASASSHFAASRVRGGSRMEGESDSFVDMQTDIPILLPVPFQELSNLQLYSPEEQLLELTGALKEQFQRHCFIKIHQQETEPMLVPFVERPYSKPKNLDWYVQRLFKQERALPAAEVDRLLEAREVELLKEVAAPASSGLPEDFRE